MCRNDEDLQADSMMQIEKELKYVLESLELSKFAGLKLSLQMTYQNLEIATLKFEWSNRLLEIIKEFIPDFDKNVQENLQKNALSFSDWL